MSAFYWGREEFLHLSLLLLQAPSEMDRTVPSNALLFRNLIANETC